MNALFENAAFKRAYLLIEKFTRFIPDKTYLRITFRIRTGKKLNLDNPQTFNEKLQWLKLYDRNPIYTTMADKYEAKKYVAEKIGEKYIIPTLGVWEHFDEINFDTLPDQFVLKCTHDSGGLVIVRDKDTFDRKAAKKKIERCLKRNYYWQGREWPYKNIKPRIIAEVYMQDSDDGQLKDYKVFCFKGEPKVIQVDYDRFIEHKRSIYTPEWEYIESELWLGYRCYKNKNIEKPIKLQQMIDLSRKLSESFYFVRTDFYLIENKIYFGELTFHPDSGMENFKPDWFNYKLGEWIEISDGGGYLIINEGFILWLRAELKESEVGELRAYKFFSFQGAPFIIQVIQNDKQPNESIDYFDTSWNLLELRQNFPNSKIHLPKPQHLQEMLEIAKKLSEGFSFLRIDLYDTNDGVFFSEHTFYSDNGMERFKPEKWDNILGRRIILDNMYETKEKRLS